MVMGADYSFELISIETYAPQFHGHKKKFLGFFAKLVLPGLLAGCAEHSILAKNNQEGI